MSATVLTERINTYFAALLITVIGAGATLIIVHIGTMKAYSAAANAAAYEAALNG